MNSAARQYRLRWVRWLRVAARAVFLFVGSVQCLFGVILGVGLVASVFLNGEGPGGGPVLVALDIVLLVPGLFALLSALEPWDPPDDRWHGLRWTTLGLWGTLISVASWAAAGAYMLLG
ncbi:MAG TPA: hypothetical protein VKV26_00175 [Dehalococcoidia bacterium]|nr:hypothetical protein [Dehalococcoidia bacterium]